MTEAVLLILWGLGLAAIVESGVRNLLYAVRTLKGMSDAPEA